MMKISRRALGALLLLAGCNADDATRNVFDSGILTRDASADANEGDSKGDSGHDHDASPGSNDAEAPRGAHCAPGEYRKTWTEYASSCFDDKYFAAGKAGLFTGTPKVDLSIDNIRLPVPMTPGEPYAASFEVLYKAAASELQFEVWGTTADCGVGTTAERLFVAPLAPGQQTICVSVQAGQAYTRLLVVYRDIDDVMKEFWTLERKGATFCATGTCR